MTSLGDYWNHGWNIEHWTSPPSVAVATKVTLTSAWSSVSTARKNYVILWRYEISVIHFRYCSGSADSLRNLRNLVIHVWIRGRNLSVCQKESWFSCREILSWWARQCYHFGGFGAKFRFEIFDPKKIMKWSSLCSEKNFSFKLDLNRVPINLFTIDISYLRIFNWKILQSYQ